MINVEQINKYYSNSSTKTHVLKDVSFMIENGDFVAICGKSGSGKSTL